MCAISVIATGNGHLRTDCWRLLSFSDCFLSLLLKVPTSVMSKYYPWKFNLVICLLISFHLLPLHFQVFVKRLRMIIPFCFLLKSTWHSVKEVLSSKLLILKFRESDLTGSSIDSYMAIVIFWVVSRCAQRIIALICQVSYSLLKKPVLTGDMYWWRGGIVSFCFVLNMWWIKKTR